MNSRKEPIIFVIGCTGTGKSDLGVEIAKKYRGEVISVDSMQFYRGLDIATNKITADEAQGVSHHMMSFLDPSSNSKYHVHQFRDEVLRIIEEIRSRQNIPILVGGTTYYAESILYEDNFIETPEHQNPSSSSSSSEAGSDSENEENRPSEIQKAKNMEMWLKLKEVDPESAKLVHPNNRARVRRALDIFLKTGQRKSDLIHAQKSSDQNADLGGTLRFDESLVIYMDATKEVLDERLDGRVEKMIKMGLKQELIEFYEKHKEFIESSKYGVMQCIGLKEFLPWLKMGYGDETLFKQGCEDVKLHTRQYSRRQRRWYISRLLKRSDGLRKMASTKMLDTSDKGRILEDGMEIATRWMEGEELSEKIENQTTVIRGNEANQLMNCEICEMMISGRECWEKHLVGKKHKAMVKRMKNNIV